MSSSRPKSAGIPVVGSDPLQRCRCSWVSSADAIGLDRIVVCVACARAAGADGSASDSFADSRRLAGRVTALGQAQTPAHLSACADTGKSSDPSHPHRHNGCSEFTMQPAAPTQRNSRKLFLSPNIGDILQMPPRSAPRVTSALDAAINKTWNEWPADAAVHATNDSIHLKFRHPGFEGEWEVLRVAPGVWLSFGDHMSDEPQPRWSQERQLRSFSIYLRGGAVFGLPEAPQHRYMFVEGQAVGLSTTVESMLCSTPLPGVRNRGVSVFFENEEAMRNFGLDVDEANQWLQTGSAHPTHHPCKVVTATANVAATRAAQAICGTDFVGARRKLFLRAKTAELLCYLMANPSRQLTADDAQSAAPLDDAMIAALAHEALSDPERCPELHDVAERLRVSIYRLRAAFKNTYGISMRDHMLAARMARARHMLKLTDAPLIEVAFACGYEHHSSFSTAYRLAFGETPAEARRSTFGA